MDPSPRPAKIARRDARDLPEGGEVERKIIMYFDLLKFDENNNIARHMSQHPYLKNWPKYIEQYNLAKLYKIDGVFGSCLEFLSLCLEYDGERNDAIYPESLEVACEIIDRRGDNFKTLQMGGEFMERMGRNKLNELREQLPNLDSLTMNLSCGLRRRGFMMSIPLYCASIRELTLTGLKKQHYRGSNIWESIGDSLKILTLRPSDELKGQIRKIQASCRGLTHVDISCFTFQDGYALSECLISYKDQLQYATIRSMSREIVKKVVESCKNARFRMEFDCFTTYRTDYLKILGQKLEAVEFHTYAFENREDLTDGWNECTELEKVTYLHRIDELEAFEVAFGLRDIQALVRTPKCSLKNIQLTFADDSTEVKKSMDALANAWITTLESVDIRCPVPPSNTFKLLAERNKSLRDVSIWLPDLDEVEDDKYLERVPEIVGCFMQCRDLQFLVIEEHTEELKEEKTFDAIEDIMRLKYRHRRVAVWVLGYTYSKEGRNDFLDPFFS